MFIYKVFDDAPIKTLKFVCWFSASLNGKRPLKYIISIYSHPYCGWGMTEQCESVHKIRSGYQNS